MKVNNTRVANGWLLSVALAAVASPAGAGQAVGTQQQRQAATSSDEVGYQAIVTRQLGQDELVQVRRSVRESQLRESSDAAASNHPALDELGRSGDWEGRLTYARQVGDLAAGDWPLPAPRPGDRRTLVACRNANDGRVYVVRVVQIYGDEGFRDWRDLSSEWSQKASCPALARPPAS